MNKVFVDLHIHSALSPCADEEMTPNNIINMAMLKQLDMIAITDHNAIGNVQSAVKVAMNKPLIIIPGIEITTQEEAHLLAYFPSYQALKLFYDEISTFLPERVNRPDIFGKQLIFDEEDRLIGEDQRLLMNAVQLSFDQMAAKIIRYQGIPVPAHVMRDSFSIYSQLGYIPQELPIKTVEIGSNQGMTLPEKMRTELSHYQHIFSSDAHYLVNILERVFFIELINKSTDTLISWLGNKDR